MAAQHVGGLGGAPLAHDEAAEAATPASVEQEQQHLVRRHAGEADVDGAGQEVDRSPSGPTTVSVTSGTSAARAGSRPRARRSRWAPTRATVAGPLLGHQAGRPRRSRRCRRRWACRCADPAPGRRPGAGGRAGPRRARRGHRCPWGRRSCGRSATPGRPARAASARVEPGRGLARHRCAGAASGATRSRTAPRASRSLDGAHLVVGQGHRDHRGRRGRRPGTPPGRPGSTRRRPSTASGWTVPPRRAAATAPSPHRVVVDGAHEQGPGPGPDHAGEGGGCRTRCRPEVNTTSPGSQPASGGHRVAGVVDRAGGPGGRRRGHRRGCRGGPRGTGAWPRSPRAAAGVLAAWSR